MQILLTALCISLSLARFFCAGTLLNPSTGRCHVSADACGPGTAYDAALGLCVGQPSQLVERVRRTGSGVAPRIATEQGAVVISGATVAVHTEACPNADLDVCAIGRSIAAVQTNLDQAAATATGSITALAQSSSEARETSIGELSTSVAAAQTTAIAAAQTTTMSEVAALLGRMESAINVTKCQQNPIDACGFTKACDGGPVA